MIPRLLALSFLLPLTIGFVAIAPRQDRVLPAARELVEAERFDEAALLLEDWLRANPGRLEVHDLYAQALEELDRPDEAAWHLSEARRLLDEAGRWDSKEYAALGRRLRRADPLSRKRDALFEKIASSFGETAEKMLDGGHTERALDLLERLVPLAEGEERVTLTALRDRARAAFEQVRLDAASNANATGGPRERVEWESRFYRFECNLEREVVELLGTTMDDVFRYYVEVYFDGDLDAPSDRRVTIRIHPSRDAMLSQWGDPSRQVEGWWSPGEWKVVCYDTRSTAGSLDAMLVTLFHEASHHFMTMLTSRGGTSPAWINEGTATFFEGATAMADHRVLWPDAARGRLLNLAAMLRGGDGPVVRDVISFNEGGSYAGEYYPYGWGLVYFLLQYEDPETLEYVWRPYYHRYREEITRKGGSPFALFEEIILARRNPGSFEDFAAFEARWQQWILEEVFPLYVGKERRPRREAKLRAYLAAADAAASARSAPVPEEELLLRALGQIEVIRTELDDPDAPDGALVLQQAEVLERLGRKGTAAAMLELALEIADGGGLELSAEQREELVARMDKLDRRNAPLRQLRLRTASYLKRARSLLREYQRADEARLLRTLDFARRAGAILEDEEGLLAHASELRETAAAQGLLLSRVVRIEGETWETIFTSQETSFTTGPGTVAMSMPARVAGRICTTLPVEGEYEVRFTLIREEEVYRSSYHGVVVTGRLDRDWYAVGLGGKGKLVVKRCALDETLAPTVKTFASFALDPPLDENAPVKLAVRVRRDGTLRITFPDDPTREIPIVTLEEPPPAVAFVGVMVKDAAIRVEDLLVEIFP